MRGVLHNTEYLKQINWNKTIEEFEKMLDDKFLDIVMNSTKIPQSHVEGCGKAERKLWDSAVALWKRKNH